jgi:O-antigen ligase
MYKAKLLAAPFQLVGKKQQTLNRQASRKTWLMLLLVFAHIPLGLILYNIGSAAIIHPIAVFFVGIYYAFQRKYSLSSIALVAGYIIGAEVLWRMANVPIYWEFGKFGMAGIMITALVVRQQFDLPALPLIYGLLLVPACFISLTVFDISKARGLFSADMSGPLALVVACWFFSKTRLTLPQLRHLFFVLMLPLLSVAFVTLFYTVSVEDIQFTTESNFATSGGFGPNQVSSMLGFGVFIAIGSMVMFKNSLMLKVALGALALFFAAQSLMTFSRGGIYNAVGALTLLVIFHFRNLADGLRRIVPLTVVVVMFFWFIFPTLNNFTGGKLEERFKESSTTNRFDIVESDLKMFAEYPIFGVGVGVSRSYRERFLTYSATSHTEFARLISEHGSFGVAALILLIAMPILNLRRQRSLLRRALVMGLSTWCFLYMLNAGMRLAAPSFLWGVTFVTIVENRIQRRRVLSPGRFGLPKGIMDSNKITPLAEI